MIKWGLKNVELVTDSDTFHRWIQLTPTEEQRVETKGAAEIMVKRRLGVFRSLVNECGLKIAVTLVPSQEIKSDVLNRVRKRWLCGCQRSGNLREEYYAASLGQQDLQQLHGTLHTGVERSLFLARKLVPSVTREEIKRVVRECQRCQSINPAPVCHESGELSVECNWERFAI